MEEVFIEMTCEYFFVGTSTKALRSFQRLQFEGIISKNIIKFNAYQGKYIKKNVMIK